MARKGYRFVAHTADVKFIARGKDVCEAFRNASLAMFETIADTGAMKKSGGKTVKFVVSAKADSYDDLLWKMLQRCLSISSARGLFCYDLSRPQIRKSDGVFSVKTMVSAMAESPDISKLEVKGVSKYGLSVAKAGPKIKATVVVDV